MANLSLDEPDLEAVNTDDDGGNGANNCEDEDVMEV